jgi:hypothetical protein
VYCASSPGSEPRYRQQAVDLGRLLAGEGITLVYGGAAVGLMGALADSALEAGGEVVGVIPKGLFRREIAHHGLTKLIEVDSMHARKQLMFELADAFVALPGGLGTLEELAEVATWAQLGLHRKPIATFDSSGYWTPFHQVLRQAVKSGFMNTESLALITGVDRLDQLLASLARYSVPDIEKWIELDET